MPPTASPGANTTSTISSCASRSRLPRTRTRWCGRWATHLGAPTLLTTEAGSIAWQAHLDVYGVPRKASGQQDPTSRFPGQLCDEETGLYYNRHRYYDPESGRYISEDPIGLRGGLAPYSYVSDPLMWLDPGGLKRCKIPKKTKDAMGPKPSDMINPHRHHIVMEGLLGDGRMQIVPLWPLREGFLVSSRPPCMDPRTLFGRLTPVTRSNMPRKCTKH